MKKKNIIAVLVAVVVIIAAVLLVSRYLKARTPILLQGTTECTTYKASSKIAGRIVDMKVEEGQRVERGELLYTLSTPELDAKLQQAEAVRSAASAIDQKVLSAPAVRKSKRRSTCGSRRRPDANWPKRPSHRRESALRTRGRAGAEIRRGAGAVQRHDRDRLGRQGAVRPGGRRRLEGGESRRRGTGCGRPQASYRRWRAT